MDNDMSEFKERNSESEWTHERYVKELQQFIVYPPENAQEYLECLLFEEIGEVVGVHAKYVRGDFDETEYKKRLIGELGDVLFAISLLVETGGDTKEDFATVLLQNSNCEYNQAKYDLVGNMVALRDLLSPSLISENLLYHQPVTVPTMAWVCVLCINLGITIEELREANVKKLQSRKERGKIRGDGDER